MNLEQIGIAALCVSQAGMWWHNVVVMRSVERRDGAAHGMLNRIRRDTETIIDGASNGRDRTREEHAAHGQAFAAMRDEIRAALAQMPKSRNRRRPNPDAPIDLVPTAIAPLEAAKRNAPSSDPVGKVSS